MPLAVDHAVINVLHDMDAAVTRFEALGFTLTPRGHHSLGSINHLMVFEHDYLELVGLPDGDGPVRKEVAESPIGLNGLVFATDHAGRLHARLAARSIPAQAPLALDRPVDVNGIVRNASFRIVRIDPGYLRAGRVYFCQHETPELVWRPPWQRHRNGVHALAGMTIAVPQPAEHAARYRELACEAISGSVHSVDDVTLPFGAFTLRLVTPEGYRSHYGALGCDAGGRDAFMGALALRTGSLDAVRACLDAAALTAIIEQAPDRIVVPASAAFNAALEFVA